MNRWCIVVEMNIIEMYGKKSSAVITLPNVFPNVIIIINTV